MNRLSENVLSFLKQSVSNIEELQVQTALGKAELSDKLEEIKRDAKVKLANLKAEVNSVLREDKEEFNHLKAKIEHLEIQLALGEAETLEKLKEQKKNIKDAVSDIKNIIAKD